MEANGIKFAYRSYGKEGDIPVIYFNHLTANLDNCDPRIMDAIAAERHIISFDYRGVGATTGEQGTDTLLDLAKDAHCLYSCFLGYKQVDIVAFSMGGFITQELLFGRTNFGTKNNYLQALVQQAVRGLKMLGLTYRDMFRGYITFRDPKFYLFFNQNKNGKNLRKNFSPNKRKNQK